MGGEEWVERMGAGSEMLSLGTHGHFGGPREGNKKLRNRGGGCSHG